MNKTPNGRTPIKASQIYRDLDAESRREKAIYAGIDRRNATMENWSNTPEVQEKRRLAREKSEKKEIRQKDIYELIKKSDENLYQKLIEYAKTHSKSSILTHFATQIDKNRRLHADYDKTLKEANNKTSPTCYDVYVRLCNEDPEFLLCSPTSMFASSIKNLPVYKLTDSQLKELQKRLEQDNIFNNANFRKNYIKYFPEYITKMEDLSDVNFALSKNPAMYERFKEGHLYNTMNIRNFKLMLSVAPETMSYMSIVEIKKIADVTPSKIGQVINACPKTILALNNEFFKKYPPKMIFQNVVKQDLAIKLKNYVSNIPVLEEYLKTFLNNSEESHNLEDYAQDTGVTI